MTDPLHIGRASDLKGKDRIWYRFFEILPGALSWGTLLAVFVCSFFIPTETALFIIIFDVYWLIKTLYLSLHLRYGYSQIKKNLKTIWRDKLTNWEHIYHLIILPTCNESPEIIRDSLNSLAKSNYPHDKM